MPLPPMLSLVLLPLSLLLLLLRPLLLVLLLLRLCWLPDTPLHLPLLLLLLLLLLSLLLRCSILTGECLTLPLLLMSCLLLSLAGLERVEMEFVGWGLTRLCLCCSALLPVGRLGLLLYLLPDLPDPIKAEPELWQWSLGFRRLLLAGAGFKSMYLHSMQHSVQCLRE